MTLKLSHLLSTAAAFTFQYRCIQQIPTHPALMEVSPSAELGYKLLSNRGSARELCTAEDMKEGLIFCTSEMEIINLPRQKSSTMGLRIASLNIERLQRDVKNLPRCARMNYANNNKSIKTPSLRIVVEGPGDTSKLHTSPAVTSPSAVSLSSEVVSSESLSSDDFDDNEPQPDPLTVATLLTYLDKKYPALDFPQYTQPLADWEICYIRSVVRFDEDYFWVKANMADGAVGLFLDCARRMLRKHKASKVESYKQKLRFLRYEEKNYSSNVWDIGVLRHVTDFVHNAWEFCLNTLL
ncbi:hypothetical protein BDW22DRAFT_1448984 [Trametopsis cervina]|nr:hypothetical protein BDW22DRAFT_1448984 [Trametopsis cervina]